MEIVLYQSPGACSRVTLNALEEVGCPYRIQTVNLRENAQHSPEFLAINPKGKVPALAVDGALMTETAAILYTLHERHRAVGLLPSDHPSDAFEGLADLVWCSSSLHPIVRQVRVPVRFTKGDPTGVAADGMDKFAKECATLGTRLEGRWWYGARWSIVDVYIYWAYSTAAKGGFDLRAYPALMEHAARVRARPSFQRALAVEVESVHANKINMSVEEL